MADDPSAARIIFFVLADNGACLRFLAVVIVVAGMLAALALVAAPIPGVLGAAVVSVAGGRAALRLKHSSTIGRDDRQRSSL